MISGICRAAVLPALAVPSSGLEKILGDWWFYYGLAHLRVRHLACQRAPRRKATVKKPCSGLWNLNCSQFQLRDVTIAFCCEVAIWTMTLLCGLKRQQAMKRRSVCQICDWVDISQKAIQALGLSLNGAPQTPRLGLFWGVTYASQVFFFHKLCFARPCGHASAPSKATPY